MDIIIMTKKHRSIIEKIRGIICIIVEKESERGEIIMMEGRSLNIKETIGIIRNIMEGAAGIMSLLAIIMSGCMMNLVRRKLFMYILIKDANLCSFY